jgi:EF-P beta-lysylation protein EpmB
MHEGSSNATATGPPSPPAGTASPPWKLALRDAVRDPDRLIELLGLPDALREPARRAAARFPLVIPRAYLSRIRPGDPRDPLLLQVLPLGLEEREVEGFERDPLLENRASRAPGLLHKYRGRALLIAAGACAIHCRYCFRRHFPYEEAPHGLAAWEPALAEIARDDTLAEVILSGGDPLVLTDASLAALVERLESIPHLRRLRIHTRLPIVIPERVDEGLLGWLAATRLQPIAVVHANHPREIDEASGEALLRLVQAGVAVLNQSVLLRGVNDDAPTLASLSEKLIARRTIPYYLHQLDPVAGAAHFHVPEARGRELHRELRRLLPGYAVPRYVKEVAGAPYKLEVGED